MTRKIVSGGGRDMHNGARGTSISTCWEFPRNDHKCGERSDDRADPVPDTTNGRDMLNIARHTSILFIVRSAYMM
jgi:hypothetical protein